MQRVEAAVADILLFANLRIVMLHWILQATYRVVGKYGEDFNLAVRRIAKHLPNLISPIIQHDMIRNTHAHNSLSAYACEGAH